jgi:hypothetical protein
MESADRGISIGLADPRDLVARADLDLVKSLGVRERAIGPGTDGNALDSRLARIPASVLVPVLENETGDVTLDRRLRRCGGRDGRQSEKYRGRTHKNLQISVRFRRAVW